MATGAGDPPARLPAEMFGAGLAGVALASTALAACGTSSAATGPVTLNFYQYPDVSGATVRRDR